MLHNTQYYVFLAFWSSLFIEYFLILVLFYFINVHRVLPNFDGSLISSYFEYFNLVQLYPVVLVPINTVSLLVFAD